MKIFWNDQKGSALIFVLICALLLTSTLLVILNHYSLQQRLIHQKGNLLQAKYAAEGAVYYYLNEKEKDKNLSEFKKEERTFIHTPEMGEVTINCHPWGAFWLLWSASQNGREYFRLETLIAAYPSSEFEPAVILKPAGDPLILAGKSFITGDAIVGVRGVRKGNLSGIIPSDDKLITGEIRESAADWRPEIDCHYVQLLWQHFNDFINTPHLSAFSEILRDSTDYFASDSSQQWWETPFYVTNEQLNRNNWHLHGPLILITDEPLILTSNLIMDHFVHIFSSQPINIYGNKSTFHKVLLFSSQKITLSGVNNFCGQIYSEQAIAIRDSSCLHFPTVLMVNSGQDTASIHIDSFSRVSGSLVLLTKSDSERNRQNRSEIFIAKDATVDGLICSEVYTRLRGTVNGIVITDHFYDYVPPTRYINWIIDGVIERNKLNRQFCLPLFFKPKERHLVILGDL